MPIKAIISFFISVVFLLLFSVPSIAENIEEMTSEELDEKRMALYLKMETTTSIPWYYFAAVDSYERGLRIARNDLPKEEGLIAINITQERWQGETNPHQEDQNPRTIAFFDGIGKDGNGDGVADPNDDEDLLFSFASYMEPYGFQDEDFQIGLWDYYQRDKAVQLIAGHAKTYQTFDTLNLRERSFPVPLNANYSYRSTWGVGRGWGGRRIHEGTDIFAGHGLQIKATTFGIVELKGWNKFGGWRVGIRDTNNVYHYYAHLSSFEKGIERGSIVKPGDVIGYVGSSGYGKEGTQGKFPPHLHYGMYRDNGFIEWSFDPHPSLRIWERAERKRKNS